MGYDPGRAPEREYPQPTARYEGAHEHRAAVVGLTALAGTLMLLVGLWNIAIGIVALSRSHIYVTAPVAGYTFRWNLTGWGWADIGFGILVFATGLSVFLGMAWARYLGAVLAVIGAVGHFLLLPFTPIWSILVIALYALVIWALLYPRQEARQF